MIVITTRTPNSIAIEVVQNGKTSTIITQKEFEVITSEQVTDSITDLSNTRLITFVEVSDPEPEVVEEVKETPRRGKRNKNQEEPKEEEVVQEVQEDNSESINDSVEDESNQS